MKQFLAVFYGSKASMEKWSQLDEVTRKQREKNGMQAWGAWVGKNEKSIAFMGSPLGKTKKIDPSGVSDFKNELTAFTVVSAETPEAAAQMFLNHPHFAEFPGDRVEVVECLPIPTGPKN